MGRQDAGVSSIASRSERAHARGDAASRERHLREAHRLYTEMGATGHAERLARELEGLGA